MAENRRQFLVRIGQQAGGTGRASRYAPGHAEKIIALAKGGAFPEAWAIELGVTPETLRLWARRYPEFREAIVMCHMHLLSFWTKELIRNLNSGTARPGLFSLLLRRFPAVFGRNPVDFQAWLLEPEPDCSDGVGSSVDDRLADVRQMTDEELEARLQELLRRAGKSQNPVCGRKVSFT